MVNRMWASVEPFRAPGRRGMGLMSSGAIRSWSARKVARPPPRSVVRSGLAVGQRLDLRRLPPAEGSGPAGRSPRATTVLRPHSYQLDAARQPHALARIRWPAAATQALRLTEATLR